MLLLKLTLAATALASLAAFPAAGPAAQAQGKEASHSGRYEIDNVHTAVLFQVNHLGVSNSWGRFNRVSGTLIVDDETPAESMIRLEIDAASIDTNDETGVPDAQKDARDKHLRGADFFNVEEFPTLEFESEQVKDLGGGKLEVTGPFTMHGVTRPITAIVTRIGAATGAQFGTRIGYDAQLELDRTQFGMDYLPDLLGTKVKVFISLEAIKR